MTGKGETIPVPKTKCRGKIQAKQEEELQPGPKFLAERDVPGCEDESRKAGGEWPQSDW